jgi:hypothetical protein
MLGSERMISEEVCTFASGVPKPDFLGPNGREGGVGLAESKLAEERTVPVGDCRIH